MLIRPTVMTGATLALSLAISSRDIGGAAGGRCCNQAGPGRFAVRLCGLGLTAGTPPGSDDHADDMLVPVFGMGAQTLWLGKPLPPWTLAAAALVMAGLALNLLWPRLRALRARRG